LELDELVAIPAFVLVGEVEGDVAVCADAATPTESSPEASAPAMTNFWTVLILLLMFFCDLPVFCFVRCEKDLTAGFGSAFALTASGTRRAL